MARGDTVLTSRRVGMTVSILFGLFVLFDIALFGWLILKTLSQRELEKILIETRQEAEPVAEQLAADAEKLGQEDLFVVVSVAEETKQYLGSVLMKREFVRSVEIRDRDGTVVYENRTERPAPEGVPIVGPDELEGGGELRLEGEYETEVPIGELGTLVIGISEFELERRVDVLRRDLVRQASLIGAITVTLLGAAVVLLRLLFRRADRLEQQAAEAERMAMIGTLASGLAHEIRNPLNSLNLNMQMLEEEARERRGGVSAGAGESAGGGPRSRLLAITRSEISRLEHLVTDFLSYARPRPLELKEVAVPELFERVVEVLEGEIRALGIEVRVDDATGGGTIRVDRDQMIQLLLNLVKNALAAAAEVEGRTPVAPGLVELRAFFREARTVIEVADNGSGIAAGDRPKIFDLFFSTRKGGTGLGLAIVERIARLHDAEIAVESTPGEGTTVRLLLPRRVSA